ncbi:hypothetical protein ROZALSC1DRAFT_26785 [Rozella allomycis CSF55]|uniref:SAC3/GANP/Nin1/mts3/eIF-3 p25 domain-containing protein n=1 Tax=Rozella allomycis (strain CSF55) TaxID=988480 RepID=A0A075AW73_ROZAC|nr:SAC3/GANP/Nin1/mts3/eIF-3 p25 domain-containing protein [Rozella allomycis CSF55]RKP21819.1 hypothetical protein ROZALSC1DRAFT_26785 [Rozella allomycis CSF55]|eukprot:EPZ34553.1 SAC3/GANP/Nin1/mts3/eIF-3 p25 domain-containing protein [Rozella allomycis CSF55]
MNVNSCYDQLKNEMSGSNPDLKKCGQYLSVLKASLIPQVLGNPKTTDVKNLVVARDVLELGALWSIRMKDIPSFERFYNQLKTFYHDYKTIMPESPRMYSIFGLYLLCLLSQSRIADFHSAIELIDSNQLLSNDNPFVRHPVQLEQYLMEGAYNKVWYARGDVPGVEYNFFMDILMETVRAEIATSIENAYDYLPLQNAANLLYFKEANALNAFIKQRNWNVKDNIIYFKVANNSVNQVPCVEVYKKTMEYARELEKIV